MANPTTYQRHIDGLRAVAVLCVVFFHYGQTGFGGGFVGVDVFFVISGYLISNLILGEISATGDFSFKRFYIRRIRRLFPALAVTLAFSLIFALALFSPEQLQNYGRSLAAAVFSVSNIQFWLDSGYFDNGSHLKPLLHTWSLSVEEQFYLIWPALLWFFARGASPRRQFMILAILGSASFALNYLWVNSQIDAQFSETIFYLTPFRIFELVIGGMAIFLTRLKTSDQWQQELTMAIGLALISYAVFSYSELTILPYTAALAPCIGALFVIISPRARIIGSLLNNRLSVGIGLISYSLYLVHWPVLVFYEYYTFVPLDQFELAALFVLSCALSVLMYIFVEKPFRKKSSGRDSTNPQNSFVFFSLGLMIFIGIAGFGIAQSGGDIWKNNNTMSLERISYASQERFELIRKGCSVLRLEKSKYCKTKRSRQILVIGNSHEPDGYNIFSQVYHNNPNVNLITFGSLNSCKVSLKKGYPSSAVKHRQCDIRTAVLANNRFLDTLDGVIFSSNQPFNMKQKAAWEILEYLRKVKPNIPIVVLGGYLNTTYKCSDLYYRFGSFSACSDPAHVSYNPFSERKSSEVDESKTLDYLYIDKTRLLCTSKKTSSCETSVKGEPAFYDWHHLSLSFSRHLGSRIAQRYRRELRKWGFPAVISAKTEKKPRNQAGEKQKEQAQSEDAY